MGCDSELADWSQTETGKVMCIQAFSVHFLAELWGWIRNILLVYLQDPLPGWLGFIIISLA